MRYNEKRLSKLLLKVNCGNIEAFDELYYEFSGFVYNVALSVLCNAEKSNDVVQEVFIKLYKLPSKNLPKINSVAWLYKTTKNEALSFLRKEEKEYNMNYLNKCIVDNFEEKVLDNDLFEKILLSFDYETREILVYKIIAGMTHKQISKILTIPEGTIRWKYSQAIKEAEHIYKKMWRLNDE